MKINENEAVDIKKYIEEMKNEISNWKTIYRQTKTAYEDHKKFNDKVNLINWIQCETNDLSEDDVAFINARPDYTKTIRKLEELAAKTEILKHEMYMLNCQVNTSVQNTFQILRDLKCDLGDFLFDVDNNK